MKNLWNFDEKIMKDEDLIKSKFNIDDILMKFHITWRNSIKLKPDQNLCRAPSYANIFMARKIDILIKNLAVKFGNGIFPIRFLFLGARAPLTIARDSLSVTKKFLK